MDGQNVVLGVGESYFNVEDYDDPLGSVLENKFNYALLPGYTIERHLKIRVNTAYDFTSLFYAFAPIEYTYYSIDRVQDRLLPENANKDALIVYLQLDYQYLTTERKLYTFYDMLGQVGGFMGIVIWLASLTVSSFSNNMYTMNLLSHMYKIDSEEKNNSSKVQNLDIDKSNTKWKNTPKSSVNVMREEEKHPQDATAENQEDNPNIDLVSKI
jgi:hypothetical protein